MSKRLYRLREVERMTGLSRWTLKNWSARGLISASKSAGGGTWLMSSEQINELLKLLERTGA